MTLSATWVIGEYSEVILEGGLVDEDQPKPVSIYENDIVLHILDTVHLILDI